ncbi:MAG: AmmeMemoRadiSam system protein B [Nitrososphaerales archaeon]
MRDLNRSPDFAGIFYPSKKDELLDLLNKCFYKSYFGPKEQTNKLFKQKIYGFVVPHAAYEFSGSIAAQAYYEILDLNTDTFIIIAPDHNGIGSKISILTQGSWQTPLGIIKINTDIASKIMKNSTKIEVNVSAHKIEHSIEIQIPFIQFCRKNQFRIVPILVRDQDVKTAIELGRSIAESIYDENVIIIATSDFTHYESNEQAHNKDLELIKTIENLEIDSFYSTIKDMNISLCGYGPIASAVKAVQIQGAKKGTLLKYATSGEIQSDYRNTVVGYCALAFT